MTSFCKKHWIYCKNDPMEKILVWYCVLRFTYANLLILNDYVKDFMEKTPMDPSAY